MATRPRHKFSLPALVCFGWLTAAAGVESAEPLIWTNRLASATNDPFHVLLQQQRESLQEAVDELRQEVSASSRQIMDKATRETDALSQRVNETLSTRLDLIENHLTQRHERELEAMRNSNRTFLTIAGLFAGLGFLGIVIAAAILARAINRFSEVAMNFPTAHSLARSPEHAVLGAGSLHGIVPAQFEQASARFAEAMERLERRIKELENSSPPALSAADHAPSNVRDHGEPAQSATLEEHGTTALRAKEIPDAAATAIPPDASTEGAEVSVLLGRGQALLNLGQAEEAIDCFSKAIALDPKNADAFVKKGMAMERLQRLEEAIENYDCAIALNDTITLAYLYKGAVCNKLQRFREALECYEKALKSEQKSVAA